MNWATAWRWKDWPPGTGTGARTGWQAVGSWRSPELQRISLRAGRWEGIEVLEGRRRRRGGWYWLRPLLTWPACWGVCSWPMPRVEGGDSGD